MPLVTLTRVIKFGFQNFFRNLWLALVSVTIITLSLVSVSMLGVLNVLSSEALTQVREKIDISVYLRPELKAEEVAGLKTEIETIDGVRSVAVVTPEEALVRFKERHSENPVITESLLELGDNPLGANLTIKALSEEGYQKILDELASTRFKPFVQEARFDDYRKVAESITELSNRLTQAGQAVSLVFVIISLLVVFNTMRINIYTHREEIGIMRLVGAGAWFIRAPFWVESILYSLIATLITAAIFFPSLNALQPYVTSFFNGDSFDLVAHFTRNSFAFFGYQFLGAAALSIVAATVAMRRYLKI